METIDGVEVMSKDFTQLCTIERPYIVSWPPIGLTKAVNLWNLRLLMKQWSKWNLRPRKSVKLRTWSNFSGFTVNIFQGPNARGPPRFIPPGAATSPGPQVNMHDVHEVNKSLKDLQEQVHMLAHRLQSAPAAHAGGAASGVKPRGLLGKLELITYFSSSDQKLSRPDPFVLTNKICLN